MPTINERAKAFEMDLAARFGAAVKTRRAALKVSASEVARRTAEMGYPISRTAIAKIESNSRSGKVDVAELFVLSAALDIPPVFLLFFMFPGGQLVEVIPGHEALPEDAARWLSGRISFPRRVGEAGFEDPAKPPNEGVKVIMGTSSVDDALEEHISLVNRLERASDASEAEVAERTLQLHDEQIAGMLKELGDSKRALWGLPGIPEPESDG